VGSIISLQSLISIQPFSVEILSAHAKFRAESGEWLDLDISSYEASTIQIFGQTVGTVSTVDSTKHRYNISIVKGDVYQIIVEIKYESGFT